MQAALRVRTRWFREDRARAPADVAWAITSAAWRIARHALDHMRAAGFDIAAGEDYFAFLAEFLAFEVAIADRIACARLPGAARVDFTVALARRLAAMLDDNASELLGTAPGAARARFIDLVNARSDDYAHFAYRDDGPAFAMLRAFASFVSDIAAAEDRSWTAAQAVEVEAPAAASALATAMNGLLPSP